MTQEAIRMNRTCCYCSWCEKWAHNFTQESCLGDAVIKARVINRRYKNMESSGWGLLSSIKFKAVLRSAINFRVTWNAV